ncbi:MAG: bifunctional enoyl-CoA hydratase/phosphate acetyltransferase [Gammaproteobacteria bacterium]
MVKETIENRTFAEIVIGDSATLTRTLSREDISLFAEASGDLNPTQLDGEYMKKSGRAGVVAHSLWGGALISSLLGNKLPGPGTVYRRQDLQFLQPVHVGDTVTLTITVKDKRGEDSLVIFDCRLVNQEQALVLTGTAEVRAPTEKWAGPVVEAPGVIVQRHDRYKALIERCSKLDPVSVAVAHPCEETALRGAIEATQAGLIVPILVGPRQKILSVAEACAIEIKPYRIVDVKHSHAAAAKAVELVRAGEAEVLMKGSLHTDELLGAVVSSSTGLRTERRITHVFVMDVPTYHKVLLITDAAINIAPDLDAKRDICQNAIDLARALGIALPKVAILSAVETVRAKIASTVDAAALCKMAERGQITGALLDGPLAMDNAISKEAAKTKGIESEVAGDADILLAPDLEAGNILAKQLTFLAEADAAGLVLGARVPIVLTSRADSVRSRMASCAVAVLYAHALRGGGKPSASAS